ncbi:hypothetical protein EUAN_11060 [Andreesenia angusta]|uniref:DUF7305 domain-containing protein n=1 Tax=Andreesenia angusta TaxID=39480 RepID=A0A1S1V7H1_9FIRM|nr:pilus assembly PilX N-terminal domain-containing protein [Andreesenia angusta]OHW62541.1 hypothetical protein EUAN_11060 [Andreesenia angusta]
MKIGNNRGGTLVLVIIVMAVLAVLGAAFVTATTGEGLQAINHQHKTQAHYYARSGAYMGLEWLDKYAETEEGKNWLKTKNPKEKYLSGNLEDGLASGEDKEAEVNLSFGIDEKSVSIKSTGREGKQSDTVKLNDIGVSVGEKYVPQISVDMAIFSFGKITLGNKVNIKGDIGTKLPDDGSSITKKGSGTLEERVDGEIKYNQNKEYPLPKVPDFGSKKPVNTSITVDGYYSDITSSTDINLVGGATRQVVVDKFNLGGSNEFKATGSGTLVLFIKDYFDIYGNAQMKISPSVNLVIFYMKKEDEPEKGDLKINGNTGISGLIYAPNASITFTGSSDPASVALIGNTVNMNGSAKSLGNNPLIGTDIEYDGFEGESGGTTIDKSKKVWSKE